ncbi:MAG: TrkH family potassium uptake protein [Clostridia bacterium]|nr:TrkH family potassium uptake protein [Clostridia bacterium]
MNYKIIKHILSKVLVIEAFSMIFSLLCAFIYKETKLIPIWLISIFICFAASFLISRKSPENKSFYAKEGFVAVALSWIFLGIFGAIPFFISGYIPSFIDAVFETSSGFTTTGASILTNVEALPKSLLFWRSFTHWIGGMGVLVFLVAILPLSGGDNFFLIKAESPGPSVSKLVPRVKHTAKILYKIYIVLTFVQIVLLLLGGMEIFDAITLSMGTAGTGGFGIKNTSIADYNTYSQIVITVFMFIFGVDFSLYHLLLMGKPGYLLKSDEFKAYFIIVFSSIILIALNCMQFFSSFWETLKHSAFQVVSIITTTGYATTNYDKWPEFSKTIILFLTFVGACAGSTGGGFKVSRLVILLKSIAKEIRVSVHPKSTVKLKMNGRLVEHETVRAVNVFMASYIIIFAVSLLLVSIDGKDFTTSFTSVLTTLGNVGPGLAAVGPAGNFSSYSAFSKIVLTLDMLIGRLEIFPILILFSSYTRRK